MKPLTLTLSVTAGLLGGPLRRTSCRGAFRLVNEGGHLAGTLTIKAAGSGVINMFDSEGKVIVTTDRKLIVKPAVGHQRNHVQMTSRQFLLMPPSPFPLPDTSLKSADENPPPAPLPSLSSGDPKAEPEPKFPPPDPDPEWQQPGVSPLPVREPEEPGPDVIDPGLEPLPA